MRYLSGVALLAGLVVAACGGGSSGPASPSPTPVNGTMSGTWTGTSADSTGQEKMTWTVTEAGTSMTGTMNFADAGRNMMGNGSMQGTISGSTVSFHISVPTGGFSGMMSSCAMGMDGQATMSDDGHTMTGTYAGSMSGMMSGGMMNQSCGGSMANGHFTLTR